MDSTDENIQTHQNMCMASRCTNHTVFQYNAYPKTLAVSCLSPLGRSRPTLNGRRFRRLYHPVYVQYLDKLLNLTLAGARGVPDILPPGAMPVAPRPHVSSQHLFWLTRPMDGSPIAPRKKGTGCFPRAIHEYVQLLLSLLLWYTRMRSHRCERCDHWFDFVRLRLLAHAYVSLPRVEANIMLVSKALEAFLLSYQGSKSPATLDWYQRRLSSLIKFLDSSEGGSASIEHVTTNSLRLWRVHLMEQKTRWADHPMRETRAGGLSLWTLHGYLRAARHFFKWLADEGILTANPAIRLELPRLPKDRKAGIPQSDAVKILDTARDLGIPRDYAIVLFLAETMCRVGGVVNLRLGDLDLDRGRARVVEKGNKSRPVYLEQRGIKAMRVWLMVRPSVSNDYVFLGRSGNGLTVNGVYQVLKRLAKAAGVPKGWNPHNWRHGGARAMQRRGMPTGVLSQTLGHSSVEVTVNFYGTSTDDDLKTAHTQYSWIPPETSANSVEPDSNT